MTLVECQCIILFLIGTTRNLCISSDREGCCHFKLNSKNVKTLEIYSTTIQIIDLNHESVFNDFELYFESKRHIGNEELITSRSFSVWT